MYKSTYVHYNLVSSLTNWYNQEHKNWKEIYNHKFQPKLSKIKIDFFLIDFSNC